MAAPEPDGAWESFAAHWPDAVVLGADLPAPEGRDLVARLREADPGMLLLVADKAHLGRAVGIGEILDLRPNAYVTDPTSRELGDRVRQLLAQSPRNRLAPPVPSGASRVRERPPLEQGDVRPGEVAEVLVRLWRAGADGILEVLGRECTRSLFLLRGVAVAFESDARAERLSRWLVSSGNLSEAQHRSALDAAAGGQLSEGAALVAAGAIPGGAALETALRAHLCAMVSKLTGEREGRWRFYPGSEFEGEVEVVEVPALAPVLDGVRQALSARYFASGLRGRLGAYPARTAEFARLVPALALGSADLRLALGLSGEVTTREFLDARRADLRDAISLLWFLERVGAATFHDRPSAGTGAGRLPAAAGAPRRRKPLPEARAQELRQAALRVLPASYFAALGVDIASDVEEVERAYREAATRFQPEAYAEFDVGPLEDLLTQVQDKLQAAYRVLSNEEKRRAYLSFHLARVAAETGCRRGEVVAEAEVALKRAERALRARRASEAVGSLHEAVALNPEEPEYWAVLAFATLVDVSLPRVDRLREAGRHARRALAEDPGCVRALVTLALAAEAAGEPNEARQHVLQALRHAPASRLARRVLARLNRPRG